MAVIDLGLIIFDDYEELENKPAIDSVELTKDSTADDLNLAKKSAMDAALALKVDKDFADATSGYVLGDLTLSHEAETNLYSIHKTAVSPDGQPTREYDFALTLASETDSGLMPKESVQQLSANTLAIAGLQGKSSRYAHDFGETEPEPADIDSFAQEQGLSEPYEGVAIVNTHNYTIWHWYNGGTGWHNDGSDTVTQASNTTLGIVMGDTSTPGKVYVEADGTMSVIGWDEAQTDIENNATAITSLEENKVDKEGTASLMTEAEHEKLEGIEAEANKYLLPADVPHDADYVHTDENYTGADKAKLAGIEAGAEVNTVKSVNDRVGNITLSKTDVGLGNADNTSDVDKPVSTAQAEAISNAVEAEETRATEAEALKVNKSFTNTDDSVTTYADNGTIIRTYSNGSFDKFFTESDGGGYEHYDSATLTTLFMGADGGNLELYDKNNTGEGVRVRTRTVNGKKILYYLEDGANREPVDTDEVVTRRIMATYISGETGKSKGAVATYADLATITGMTVNDYAYVLADETLSGETWRYDYDGTNWIATLRINEVSSVPDNDTLEADNQNIWTVKAQAFAITEDTNPFSSGASLGFKQFWQATLAKINGIITALAGKEPSFTKNTAFNKDFGKTTGTVAEGASVGVRPIPDDLLAALQTEGFVSCTETALQQQLTALPVGIYSSRINITRGADNLLNLPNDSGNGITAFITLYRSTNYVIARLIEEGDLTTIAVSGEWEGKWSGSIGSSTCTWQTAGSYGPYGNGGVGTGWTRISNPVPVPTGAADGYKFLQIDTTGKKYQLVTGVIQQLPSAMVENIVTMFIAYGDNKADEISVDVGLYIGSLTPGLIFAAPLTFNPQTTAANWFGKKLQSGISLNKKWYGTISVANRGIGECYIEFDGFYPGDTEKLQRTRFIFNQPTVSRVYVGCTIIPYTIDNT
jgi:hypothetical protein